MRSLLRLKEKNRADDKEGLRNTNAWKNCLRKRPQRQVKDEAGKHQERPNDGCHSAIGRIQKNEGFRSVIQRNEYPYTEEDDEPCSHRNNKVIRNLVRMAEDESKETALLIAAHVYDMLF